MSTLSLLGVGASGLQANPLAAGLTYYYSLNNNVLKSRGTHDGIGVDLTYEADTQGNRAIFNGTTSRAYIDESVNFNFGSSDFTLNIDFILSAIGITQFVFGQCNVSGSTNTTSVLGLVDTANNLTVYICYAGNSFVEFKSALVLTTNQKYVVVFKRQGNAFTLKINDSLGASGTHAVTINQSIFKMGLGNLGESIGPTFFNGKICLFRGWDRALTALEETELYNGGLGLKFAVSNNTSSDLVQAQLVDGSVIGYATFQSNSQRCVVNINGIFIIHTTTTSGSTFTNQVWQLKQSTDGGRTFNIVYTSSTYDQVPTLETDSSGNLYVFNTTTATNVNFLKFANTNYTTPSVTTSLTISVSSKFSAYLDEANNRIYHSNNVGELWVLNMSGTLLIAALSVYVGGTAAYPVYPSLTCDTFGNVYLGMTSQQNVGPIVYYSIAWLKSADYGATWTKANGTTVTLPAVIDRTGPSIRTPEFVTVIGDENIGSWLSGWTFVNGKLHAVYWLNGISFKYVRINPTTGAIEVTVNIQSTITPALDGFFSRNILGTAAVPTPIYLTSHDNTNGKVTTYVSTNNGTSWTFYAERNRLLFDRTYSLGGYREQVNSKAYGLFTLTTTRSFFDTENYAAYIYTLQVILP